MLLIGSDLELGSFSFANVLEIIELDLTYLFHH